MSVTIRRSTLGPRVTLHAGQTYNKTLNIRGSGNLTRLSPSPTTRIAIQGDGGYDIVLPDGIRDSVSGLELDTTNWVNTPDALFDNLNGTAWPADGAVAGSVSSSAFLDIYYASDLSESSFPMDAGVEVEAVGNVGSSGADGGGSANGSWSHFGFTSLVYGFYQSGIKPSGMTCLLASATSQYLPNPEVTWGNKSWIEVPNTTRDAPVWEYSAPSRAFFAGGGLGGSSAVITVAVADGDNSGTVLVDSSNNIIMLNTSGHEVGTPSSGYNITSDIEANLGQ